MNETDTVRNKRYLAWNRHLYQWWDYYNDLFLNGRLKRPIIRLAFLKSALGKWAPATRTITLSIGHIEKHDWLVVMDTLRHEMAHQYVDEVLHPVNETAHGRAFQTAGQRLRCVRGASGPDELPAEDRSFRIFKKVLSLAASPNENEAQLAVQKARELMLKYNIDRVALDRESNYSFVTLGAIKGRHTAAELRMAALLGRFFFVEVLWQHSYDARQDNTGTVLTIYGTPPNLEMAHYVYDYLWTVMASLWADYKANHQISNNRQRQRYFAGVLDGFYGKLEKQEQGIQVNRALVWKGDSRLSEYYRYLNPRVRTYYGGGMDASAIYQAGVNDGRKVVLHRPIEEKTSFQGRYLTRG